MSLGVDMPPGLAGVEPDSSLRGRKQMAEIQGGPPQGDQVKDFSNLNNDSMILDHHRGSQDSLDPTKLYALSAQEAEDSTKNPLDSNRRNDRTHLEKKKEFQLPEIVKARPP